MLNNKYVIAIVIPLVLLLANAVVRKLGQGQPWKTDYFYLGAELSLTALGASMLYVYDLTRPGSSGGQKITATVTFMVVCLFLLLAVVSIHQDYENQPHNKKGQIIWLGVVSNLVGIALFVAFTLLVKGV